MFNKKNCQNCDEKIKDSYNFCSNCGFQLKQASEKWGMLGKNDAVKETAPKLFSGISGSIMNKMLGSAMKMLEKEMMRDMPKNNKMPNTNMRLMINGKEITPPKKSEKDPKVKILPIDFSEENLGKWRSLKKSEPKSELQRKEDKLEYKIEVPEVKSIKDISIIKLENSIEVRAIGDKKAYLKRVPIDLPLKKYSLLKGILTLELDVE